MKRISLLLGLCILGLSALAQTKVIATRWNNKWSIAYKVQKGESLNSIAQKFSANMTDLAAFNLINVKRPLYEKQILRIPLTAQNFSSQIVPPPSESKMEILYFAEKEDQIASVCKKFEITEAQFRSLNPNKNEIYAGRELTIGWIISSLSVADSDNGNPTKVADKSTRTPHSESQVAQSKKTNSEAEIQYRKIDEKPGQLFANGTVKTERPVGSISYSDDVVQSYSAMLNEREDIWGKFKGIFTGKKKSVEYGATEPVLIKNDPNRTASGAALRKNERAMARDVSRPPVESRGQTLSMKEVPKSKPNTKRRPNDSLDKREFTAPKSKPHYNGMKYNQMAKSEIPKSQSKQLAATQKNAGKVVNTKNPVQKEHRVLGGTEPKENKKAENGVEDKTIRNEIKPLTLTQVKSGTASYFPNAMQSGKFYVATNLADKGNIIKVTNPENGKSLYAEVISDLPYAESKKGILLKISDNAKLPLGQKSNSFTVKVNY